MKDSKKINWRVGIVTTIAAAALTATLTNYAVWNQEILTDYTYTNDDIGMADEVYIGGSILSTVLPSTDLVAEQTLTIYDAFAEMSFVDSTNPDNPSWSIGQVANDGSYNVSWRGDMDNNGSTTFAVVENAVINLEANSTTNSIETFANGDVSFADGDLYWDDSSGYLGIGTSTPSSNLDIHGTFAWTKWNGSAGNWDRFINSITGDFVTRNGNNGLQQSFILKADVGAHAIVADATGVGIGTYDPAASLEIERSDGTAKLLVEENSATIAKRTMVELKNNGAPSMQFTNTGSGSIWQLNPDAADNFIISQLGTGGPEVQIRKTTGNMVVRGTVSSLGVLLTSSRETKEEFMPVDNAQILDKVSQLKISEWKFKTDSAEAPRHIGPMAEDFEQAFELGTDGKTIGVTDMNGVTLASIQALHAENKALKQRLERLEKLIQQ